MPAVGFRRGDRTDATRKSAHQRRHEDGGDQGDENRTQGTNDGVNLQKRIPPRVGEPVKVIRRPSKDQADAAVAGMRPA